MSSMLVVLEARAVSRTTLLWGFTFVLLMVQTVESLAAFLAFATYDWIKLGQEGPSSPRGPLRPS